MSAAAAAFYTDLGFPRVRLLRRGDETGHRAFSAPQGQSARHGVPRALGAALSSLRLHRSRDASMSCARSICAGNLGFGGKLEHGPGHHGHGHSYYVYLRDPDGHRVELLLPAVQIIDIDDEPMRYEVKAGNTNLWGCRRREAGSRRASPLVGAKVSAPEVQGEPLTLEKIFVCEGPKARQGGAGEEAAPSAWLSRASAGRCRQPRDISPAPPDRPRARRCRPDARCRRAR